MLDACGQSVETLVTQHGDLVMQSASSDRKLEEKRSGINSYSVTSDIRDHH